MNLLTTIIASKKNNSVVIPLSGFIACFPLLFYFANLFRLVGHSAIPYVGLIIIVGLLGCVQIFADENLKHNNLGIIFLIYMLTGVINFIAIGNFSVSDLFSNILFFGITVVMIAYPHSYKQGKLFFYIFSLFFIREFLLGSFTHDILTSSGNYISILMILAVSFYYIGLENDKRKLELIDIIPALICFLISVWARGRGGILSCGVLLILMVSIFVQNVIRNKSKYFIVFFGFIILVGLVFAIYNFNIFDKITSLGKFGTRGLNTPRLYFWKEYFFTMDESLLYAFLGVPLDFVPSMHAVGNNAHNSFVQLHATNGLFMLLLFIVLLIQSIYYQFRRSRLVLLAVMLVIVLRGMTDKFIFGQYGMPVMLYFLFYPYFDNYILTRRERNSEV